MHNSSLKSYSTHMSLGMWSAKDRQSQQAIPLQLE